MFALIIILILDDNDAPSQSEQPVEETPTIVAEPIEDKKANRRMEIIGLAKASEGVKLINPFAVDLPKPPPKPVPKPLIIPIETVPLPLPSDIDMPTELDIDQIDKEPVPSVTLTLKGTAISDDKKFAVVNRGCSDDGVEHLLLKIGDAVDGRKVIDIGRDFVEFDDGVRLELFRVNDDG